MSELLFEVLRAVALLACIVLPAWAFVKSEDGEEM